jgi:hypothetical protein
MGGRLWQGGAWRLPILFAAWAVFVAAGCSSPPPGEAVFPVKGQLFYNNKPATGAVVWFHPVNDLDDVTAGNPAKDPRPSGIVDEQGNFELSTYGVKDGAPVGRYRVSVMWTKNKGGGDGTEENLLPPHFMDPRQSTLPIVEVKEQPDNVLVPFRIAGERN